MTPEQDADEPSGKPSPRPQGAETGGLRAFWASPTYRFAFFFLLYLGIIAVGYPELRIYLIPALTVLEDFTADIVYAIMSLFSSDVRMTGKKWIYFGPFLVTIIEECTGLYEALLLGAALLAFPTTWPKALLGFVIGFPVIYAMNIVRICVLLVAGRYIGHSFEFFHIYFWQVTMIAMVASTWLMWVIWVVRRDYGPGDATSGQPS